MSEPLNPRPALLCKLGSIVVHAEELVSPKGHAFDHTALLMLCEDDEVQEWIQQMNAMAMLPVKR
jgi:hypothetical protein